MYLKVLQGKGDTVNKFRTCTLEGEGVTFCCDSSKTHVKHLSYKKILLNNIGAFGYLFLHLSREITSVMDIRCLYWESVLVLLNLVINKQS